MDPIGRQKKIKSNEMRVFEQKIIDNGGAKSDYDGISYPPNTRKADEPLIEDRWQGKVKGKTVHTYGKDGKGDPDGEKTKEGGVREIKEKKWRSSFNGD